MLPDRMLARRLRAAVIALRRDTVRRRFAPSLHAGLPAGPARRLPIAGEVLDHALRTEVAAGLITAVGEDCELVWLTRAGHPDWHDLDAEWTGPVHAAWQERGETGRFVVVTPRGWYDPISEVSRQWLRAREHH